MTHTLHEIQIKLLIFSKQPIVQHTDLIKVYKLYLEYI